MLCEICANWLALITILMIGYGWGGKGGRPAIFGHTAALKAHTPDPHLISAALKMGGSRRPRLVSPACHDPTIHSGYANELTGVKRVWLDTEANMPFASCDPTVMRVGAGKLRSGHTRVGNENRDYRDHLSCS